VCIRMFQKNFLGFKYLTPIFKKRDIAPHDRKIAQPNGKSHNPTANAQKTRPNRKKAPRTQGHSPLSPPEPKDPGTQNRSNCLSEPLRRSHASLMSVSLVPPRLSRNPGLQRPSHKLENQRQYRIYNRRRKNPLCRNVLVGIDINSKQCNVQHQTRYRHRRNLRLIRPEKIEKVLQRKGGIKLDQIIDEQAKNRSHQPENQS